MKTEKVFHFSHAEIVRILYKHLTQTELCEENEYNKGSLRPSQDLTEYTFTVWNDEEDPKLIKPIKEKPKEEAKKIYRDIDL